MIHAFALFAVAVCFADSSQAGRQRVTDLTGNGNGVLLVPGLEEAAKKCEEEQIFGGPCQLDELLLRARQLTEAISNGPSLKTAGGSLLETNLTAQLDSLVEAARGYGDPDLPDDFLQLISNLVTEIEQVIEVDIKTRHGATQNAIDTMINDVRSLHTAAMDEKSMADDLDLEWFHCVEMEKYLREDLEMAEQDLDSAQQAAGPPCARAEELKVWTYDLPPALLAFHCTFAEGGCATDLQAYQARVNETVGVVEAGAASATDAWHHAHEECLFKMGDVEASQAWVSQARSAYSQKRNDCKVQLDARNQKMCDFGLSMQGKCSAKADFEDLREEIDGVRGLITDLNAATHSNGDALHDPIYKTTYCTSFADLEQGARVFNLDYSYLQYSYGGRWTVGQFYTHCYWIKWSTGPRSWRTLFRGNTDHAGIVNWNDELGIYSSRSGQFRGTGYKIKFDSFQHVCYTGEGESATSPQGVSKYYVGDLTTPPVFVGQADRVASGTMLNRIGWPGQGPGKLARFQAFDQVLSEEQMLAVWEGTLFEVTEEVMMMADLSARTQASGSQTDELTGTTWNTPSTTTENGVQVWNLDNSYFQRIGGTQWTVGPRYTQCFWIKWRTLDGGWRTLFRGTQDHSVIVVNGGTELGMYSNRDGGFRGSGFDITRNSWQFVCVVGEAESESSPTGVSRFFVGSPTEPPQLVGTADRVVSGTKVYRMGLYGQGPGKLAHFLAWNSALSADQLQMEWRRTRFEVAPTEIYMADMDAGSSMQNGRYFTDEMSGVMWRTPSVSLEGGIRVWNLDNTYMYRSSGDQWEVGTSYTHCFWIKWRESNSGWRTLFRGTSDHSILVVNGGTELGVYSNRNGGWRGSGYSITPNAWEFVCAVGESNFAGDGTTGTTRFFVGTPEAEPRYVGEADRVVTGSKVYRLGWYGQGPGKMKHFSAWNAAITESEMAAAWSRTKPVVADSGAPVADLDAAMQSGPNPLDTASEVSEWASKTVIEENGVKAWDLDASYLERTGGEEWTVGERYTHCYWIKFREATSGWLSLFRDYTYHTILVHGRTKKLGFYSNREGGFTETDYYVSTDSFQFLCATGEALGDGTHAGVQKFYVGSMSAPPEYVGEVDRVSTGVKIFRIGWPNSGPGKLARFTAWNRMLDASEMQSFWQSSMPRASAMLQRSSMLSKRQAKSDPSAHLMLLPSPHNDALRREEWKVSQVAKCTLQLMALGIFPGGDDTSLCEKYVDYDRDVGTLDRRLADYAEFNAGALMCMDGPVTFSGETWDVPEGEEPPASGYQTRSFHPHLSLDPSGPPLPFCSSPPAAPVPVMEPYSMDDLMPGWGKM